MEISRILELHKCQNLWISNSRSSRTERFCKKGVLEKFTKFTGKHLCQSLFFKKVEGFIINIIIVIILINLTNVGKWHTRFFIKKIL